MWKDERIGATAEAVTEGDAVILAHRADIDAGLEINPYLIDGAGAGSYEKTTVAVSPDEQYLARFLSAAPWLEVRQRADGVYRMIDLPPALKTSMENAIGGLSESSRSDLIFDANSEYLILHCAKNYWVYVLHLPDLAITNTFVASTSNSSYRPLAIRKSDNLLAAGTRVGTGFGGAARLYRNWKSSSTVEREISLSNICNHLAFTNDGKYLVACYSNGSGSPFYGLTIHDVDTGGRTEYKQAGGYNQGLAVSPDGKMIALGTTGLPLYEMNDEGKLTALPSPSNAPQYDCGNISFTQDGKYLLYGSLNADEGLLIYRVDGKTLTKITSGITGRIYGLTCSENTLFAMTGTSGKYLIACDLHTRPTVYQMTPDNLYASMLGRTKSGAAIALQDAAIGQECKVNLLKPLNDAIGSTI